MGDAGVETRASLQVVAKPAKTCLGDLVQAKFAHVHLKWSRMLTVCCYLRTIEGVRTLRSCVPLIGDCVHGARFQGLQLRAMQRGRTAGEGVCAPPAGRAYLSVDSATSSRQQQALLVVFYRDENQTARRHARMKDVNSYQRLTGLESLSRGLKNTERAQTETHDPCMIP